MTDIVEVRLCGEAFGLYASPLAIGVICSKVIVHRDRYGTLFSSMPL